MVLAIDNSLIDHLESQHPGLAFRPGNEIIGVYRGREKVGEVSYVADCGFHIINGTVDGEVFNRTYKERRD